LLECPAKAVGNFETGESHRGEDKKNWIPLGGRAVEGRIRELDPERLHRCGLVIPECAR